MTNPAKLVEFRFKNLISAESCVMNAQVVVVVVVVGCVQYSWSQVSAFSCYQKPPSDTEYQQLHNSVKTNLRTCAIISEFI